jgi:hypothetical protein
MEAALNLVIRFKERDSLQCEFSQTTYNRGLWILPRLLGLWYGRVYLWYGGSVGSGVQDCYYGARDVSPLAVCFMLCQIGFLFLLAILITYQESLLLLYHVLSLSPENVFKTPKEN